MLPGELSRPAPATLRFFPATWAGWAGCPACAVGAAAVAAAVAVAAGMLTPDLDGLVTGVAL